MISVLMPAKNAELHIRASVKSTLRALGEDDELIVFDDNSTDSTARRLSRITDKRLNVIHSDRDVGVSDALNTLASLAKGKFLARMDADDICLPWRFSVQSNLLCKMPGGILFGNTIRFGDRFPLPEIFRTLPQKSVRTILPMFNPLSHSTMITQRDTLLKLLPYKNGKGQDYEMWLRAAIAGIPMVKHRLHVVCYREHKAQVSKGSSLAADDLDALRIQLQEELLGKTVAGSGLDEKVRELERDWMSFRDRYGRFWPLYIGSQDLRE